MDQLQSRQDRPKGVVNPAAAKKVFRLERYLPEPDLAPFVEHFWLVQWSLPDGVTHVQRTLPYPCVNMVFDQGRSAVFGVMTGAFDYTLQGSGRVLGVRFRPGAFRGFLQDAVHSITDRTVPIAPLFACDAAQAEREVFAADTDAGMVAVVNAMLRAALPQADPALARVEHIFGILEHDLSVAQVPQLAAAAGLSERRLQMLFRDYVGVGPKWVIRRKRLHEAADQLANGQEIDLASLALQLGYFDQAHFTRDFEMMVGRPPADYRRACRADGA